MLDSYLEMMKDPSTQDLKFSKTKHLTSFNQDTKSTKTMFRTKNNSVSNLGVAKIIDKIQLLEEEDIKYSNKL